MRTREWSIHRLVARRYRVQSPAGTRNFLEQEIYSQLLTPTQRFILSRSINEYQPRLGSKSYRAHVGLASNICRAAVGAVPYTLVLPASCQQCKASSGHDGSIFNSRYRKRLTLTFNFGILLHLLYYCINCLPTYYPAAKLHVNKLDLID